MRNSFGTKEDTLFGLVRYGVLALFAGGILSFISVQAHADTFDEVASEDAVIGSGAPDVNLEIRRHSDITRAVDNLNQFAFVYLGRRCSR